LEIYEIEVSEKNPSEIESNLFQNQLKYELIAIKKGTEIHAYLVEAYSSLNHILFTNSIQNLSAFTGTLNVYQLEGNSIGQLVVFNGHSKKTTEKSVIEPLNEVINLYNNKQSLTNKAPECVEMYTVFTLALIREYHFVKITVGGIITTKYSHTTLETVKSKSHMNTPYPCGTNGDSHYILQRTTINRDVIDEIVEDVSQVIEEKIDYSLLDPCSKAVLEKLKNSTNNDIASIFEKFGVPKDGTYNIKIILGNPNDANALAQTETISKNNYLITIREAFIKGTPNNKTRPTDLSIAAVLIHELIHAHFKALFDDFHNNGDNCAYDNFDCLYEKYVGENYSGTIDVQHAQMFDNYVPKMAAILKEFKPGSSSQFYDDIAMSTMFGLSYFDDKYPQGSVERTRIENNRISEDTNTPRGKATPKGTVCD
jgi:hypothetical protein